MPDYGRIDDRRDFRELIKSTAKGMEQSPEYTLFFIQESFKALSEAQGEITIGDRSIRIKELGDKEIKTLCKMSKKFFDAQNDLSVSTDLVKHIKTLEKRTHEPKQLEKLKDQIYTKESLNTNAGACHSLQKQLLREIKDNAPKIEKMKFKLKMKKIALISSLTVAGLGALAGGVAVSVLSVGFGPFLLSAFLIAVGLSTTFTSPLWAKSFLKKGISKVAEEEQLQKDRMNAFELLNDDVKFAAFCEAQGITDPDNVTYEQLRNPKASSQPVKK